MKKRTGRRHSMEIQNEIKNNEKSSKDESNIILPKLNISSGLIKTPYEIKRKRF